MSKAAALLKERGAKKVYAFATHGLFLGNALNRIENSALDKVIVTNTIPKKEGCPEKIIYIDTGILLAETIRRMQQQESLTTIFESEIISRIQEDNSKI